MASAPPASAAPKEPRTVQSVSHAAGILKSLHALGKPATLSDLARRIRLSKPATYALLKTLELDGLVERGPNARYRLSWGLYELGSAVVRTQDLNKVARLHIDRLASVTGEAVLLGILDHDSVLYLDRGEIDQSFTMVANIGRRSPLHTNATGKVLLAYQRQSYIDGLMHARLAPTTSLTVTDPQQLAAELKLVREKGFALCRQEQEVGLSSVAVPVFDRAGVRAALTIAGPTSRVNGESLPPLLAELRVTAGQISARLGAAKSGR